MTRFDMSSAWNDAMQLLRGDIALTSAIVGALVLLPALAFALIGPEPTPAAPGADLAQLVAALRAELSRMAPVLLLLALLGTLAATSVLRLWLAPAGTSVGDALGFAVGLIPVILAVFVMQMFALGVAALAFLLPALYLSGRWAPTLAVLAAGDTRNPVEALKQSWAMTRGNGWRITAMLVLVQIVIAIISLLVDGVGGVFGARGSVGFAVASLLSALVAAGGALVGYALSAAIYRQLSQARVVRAFD